MVLTTDHQKITHHQRSFKTLIRDENLKFVLTDGFYATLCASRRRMTNMLMYIKNEVNNLTRDEHIRICDFDIVCYLVSHNLQTILSLKMSAIVIYTYLDDILMNMCMTSSIHSLL